MELLLHDSVRSIVKEIAIQFFYLIKPSKQPFNDQSIVYLEAAKAFERLGEVYVFSSVKTKGFLAGFKMVNLIQKSNYPPEISRAYTTIAYAYSLIKPGFLSDLYTQKALEAAPAVKDLSLKGWVFLITGIYKASKAEWAQASELLSQSKKAYEQCSDLWRAQQLTISMSWLPFLQGYYEQAYLLSDGMYHESPASEHLHLSIIALRAQLDIISEPRDFKSESITQLQERLPLYKNNEHLYVSWGLLTLVQYHQGLKEEAFSTLENTLTSMQEKPILTWFSTMGVNALIETCLYFWEEGYRLNKTIPYFFSLCTILKKSARIFKIAQPAYYRNMGIWLWKEKHNQRKAIKSFNKAIQLSNALGMPYEEAISHYEIAKYSPSNSRQTIHWNEAQSLFKTIGANYGLRKIEQVKRNKLN